MKNAIILSGCGVGLAIARSLGIHDVPVTVFFYDTKLGSVSKYVTSSFPIPHPERQEEAFIDNLMNYGKDIGGGVLFPADDATLSAVSKHKNVLEEHYRVACPGWEITKKFIDKTYTYELAEKVGVPAPRSLTPVNREQAVEFGKKIDFPCLVKPCRSHVYYERFKKKMVKAASIDELVLAYNEARGADIDVMIQEYIPGDDSKGVNYNSYVIDETPVVEFTAQKSRLSPPDTGLPRVVKSRYIEEIIDPGRKIVKAFGYHGYSCTEFKKDIRDNTYKLMEMNGRHNRSGLLAVKCGINFPWLEYLDLTDSKTTVGLEDVFDYSDDVYWIDELWDVIYFFKLLKKGELDFFDYIKPYHSKHVYSVFSLRDIKPFLYRIGGGVSKLKSKVVGRKSI